MHKWVLKLMHATIDTAYSKPTIEREREKKAFAIARILKNFYVFSFCVMRQSGTVALKWISY